MHRWRSATPTARTVVRAPPAHRDAAAVRVVALPGASQDEVLTAMPEAGVQVVPLH